MSDDLRDLLALAATALVAAAVRAAHASTVFRDDVVLLQVDPWRYRVVLERLTARAAGPFDAAAFVDPGRDDLLLAALGWTAEALGGGPETVGAVLAVYPVAVALATCPVVYLAGRWASGDRRVGLAAAGALALTPAHVYRTALGFGDHHALDYLWLAVTVAAVAYLVRGTGTGRRRWLATGVLGLALAAQVLSWAGGLLLVAPYTGVALLVLLSTLRTDDPPTPVVGPLVAGLAVATGATAAAVALLSWQTPAVVALLTAATGALGALVGAGALGRRLGGSPRRVGGALLVGTAGVLAILGRCVPAAGDRLAAGVAYFSRTTGTVAEATPLLGGDDPAATTVALFGFFAALFGPYLVWLTWRSVRGHRPGWLAVTAYAWYFLGLSAVQRRFAGELSPVFAVVVGFAAVDLLRRAIGDVRGRDGSADRSDGDAAAGVRPDVVDPRVLFVLALVGAFVVSATVAQVPAGMESRTVSDAEYEAAQRIEAYAAERSWNRSEGYVFAPVGTTRMYNYYAHGESVWLGDARRHYHDYLAATDEVRWRRELERRGTGFVVVTDEFGVDGAAALQTRLRQNLGSARGPVDGLGRYRLIYRSPDRSVAVFALVRGAVIAGETDPGTAVRVTTNATLRDGTLRYVRATRATSAGRYGVLVPYPGTYAVGGETVSVTATDVRTGATVGPSGAGGDAAGAHWTFDGDHDRFVFDERGGHHAVGTDLERTAGGHGGALAFDGDARVVVWDRDAPALEARRGLTLSAWFRTDPGTDYVDEVPFPRLVSKSPSGSVGNTSGYQLSLSHGRLVAGVGDGPGAARLVGPRVDDGRWHRAVLVWNGTVARLYVDGTLRDRRPYRGTPAGTERLVVGATAQFTNPFVGTIDEVTVRGRACPPPAVDAGRVASTCRGARTDATPVGRDRGDNLSANGEN
jgi:dolichyl-diphosphooligosaccharide--protein glycosyltransferase